MVSKLRSLVYYLHKLPERTKQILFPFSQRQDDGALKAMRSVAQPSSRAPSSRSQDCCSLQPLLVYTQPRLHKHPGSPLLAGSAASRAMAGTGNTPQAMLPAHASIHTNIPTVLWDTVAPAGSPHACATLCPSLPLLAGQGHWFQLRCSHQAYTEAANLPFLLSGLLPNSTHSPG